MKELRKNLEKQFEYIKNSLKVIKFFDLSGSGFETFKEEWMEMEEESSSSLTDQPNMELILKEAGVQDDEH